MNRPVLRTGAHPAPLLLAGLTVAAQIGYPLVGGAARDRLTVAAVLLFCAASVSHAALTRGARTALALVAVFGGGGLLMEAVGVATGVPFGSYSYADRLGPELLGVPVVVALAWTMMAWPCWVVAGRLTSTPVARAAVAGWALAAWDLFLDPQLVAAGHWTWAHPEPGLPGTTGVPLTNHLGWLLTAVVLMAVFGRLPGRTVEPADARRDAAPIVLFLWVYGSSVLALGAFFGLPAAAMWGALGMGLVAVPLVIGLLRDHRTPG